MKVLVALALAFHLVTAAVVIGIDTIDHRPERTADLGAIRSAGVTTIAPVAARLAMTEGATGSSTIGDGTSVTGPLAEDHARNDAVSTPQERLVRVSARSTRTDGRAGVFAVVGSKVTLQPGTLRSGSVRIRMEGIAWDGSLSVDAGAASSSSVASAELRLRVQDGNGSLLGETVVTRMSAGVPAATDPPGDLRATERSASVVVDVYPASFPAELRVTLFAKAEAAGGSGTTAAALEASYRRVAVAVGGAAPPTTQAPPPPQGWIGAITRAQLVRHADATSCWLLIDRGVYDITRYLRRHPGSSLPVLKACGREATEDFLTQGGRGSRHSYKAVELMAEYRIGDIVD